MCPASFEGTAVPCVLDTGANCNLISVNILEKICTNWREKPDLDSPYKKARIANDSSVDILAHKAFELTLGNFTRIVPFSVIQSASDILVGTSTMQDFNTNINLNPSRIEVRIGGDIIKLYADMEYDAHELNNISRIVLRKNESKVVLFARSDINGRNIEPGKDGIIFSVKDSVSVLIPSLSTIRSDNTIPGLVRNDGKKKLILKKDSIKANFKILPDCYDVLSLDQAISRDDWTPDELPVKFFHENPQHNDFFYSNPHIELHNVIRTVKLQGNLADDNFILGDGNKEGVYEIPHPIDTRHPDEVIENDLEKRLIGQDRDNIKNLLTKYSGVIALHTYDAGQMVDHNGDPILMKIPLKAPLPKLTRSYHLSEQQHKELMQIFDHLIANNIAVENSSYEQFGSPVFLIRRKVPAGAASNLHSSNRVIFDIRTYNEYVSSACSTPSTCVQDAVQKLNNDAYFVTSLDLKNAYLALTLHPEALKSGVSNIYSKGRCIKFLRGLTGLNLTPIVFMRSLESELNKNDDGKVSKLCGDSDHDIILWYDDLNLLTKVPGDEGKRLHFQLVERTLHRLHRMNLRISLRKCTFLCDLYKETITVLGFTVGQSAIKPCPKKVNAILNLSPPKNTKQAQSLLGSLNFLRNLSVSSLRYGHLLSMLGPLTSNTKKFCWTDENQRVFDEIKSILSAPDMCTFQSKCDTIKIIYSDASDYAYGGLCFALNVSKDLSLLEPLPLPSTFRPLDKTVGWHNYLVLHCQAHNLALAPYQCLEKGNCFQTFFSSLLILHNVRFAYNKFHDTSFFIKHILYLCIHKYPDLETLTQHSKVLLDGIIKMLEEGEVSDTVFSPLLDIFLHLIYNVAKMNVSIIFLNSKVMKHPFYNVTAKRNAEHFFIGFQDGVFFPLLLTNRYSTDTFYIESNLARDIKHERDPKVVLDYFKKVIEDERYASKCIKICKSFSKIIPDSQRKFPIYAKEARALILTLEHCRDLILESPLTISLLDSKTSYWLFSSQAQNFCVKSARYALRLSLVFPNLKILSISGRQNASDFLSRLNFSKADFVAQTLVPIMIDMSKTQKYDNKIYSLDEIKEIANTDPDLILFSEKKWKGPEVNLLYDYFHSLGDKESKILDIIRSKNKHLMINRVQNPLTKLELFEKIFHRTEILKYQSSEFHDIITSIKGQDTALGFSLKNDLLFYYDKLVMPTELYTLCVLKEHYLSVHSGKAVVEKAILTIYHIVSIPALKTALNHVHNACLPCLAVKPNLNRKARYGIFHSGPSSHHSLQMDLIEDLPSLPKVHLLVITDLYSRYITAYIIQAKTSKDVVNSMINYWSNNPLCKFVCTDNATCFQAKETQEFFKFLGIKVLQSQPYHPESRSVVERFNMTIQNGLKLFNFDSQKHFKYILPHVLYLLNSREVLNAGISPWELHYKAKKPGGYRTSHYRPELLLEYDSMNTNIHKDIEQERKNFEKCISHIERKITSRKLIQNARINKHRILQDFKVNDFVLVRDFYKFLGMNKKLRPSYISTPFKIFAKSKKGWGYFLVNLATGVQIYRHPQHLKKIKINDLDFSKIPKKICEICNLLTPQDLESSVVEPLLDEDIEELVDNSAQDTLTDKDFRDELLDELLMDTHTVTWI